MRTLIVICFGMIASGAYVLLRFPDAAVLGFALIAIPGIVVVQSSLLALATVIRPPTIDRPEFPSSTHGLSELAGVIEGYRGFKLFLARLVGVIATVYGIVTLNAYYLILGVVAVVLFWIWDRMIAADQPTSKDAADEANVIHPGTFDPGVAQQGTNAVAQLSDSPEE